MENRSFLFSGIRLFFLLSFLLSVFLFPAKSIAKDGVSEESRFVEGEVIIKYKKDRVGLDSWTGKAKAVASEFLHDLDKKDEMTDMNIRVVKTKKDTLETIEELKNDPNIEYAEPNYTATLDAIPDDTIFDDQWYLSNTGQSITVSTITFSGTPDADIDAPEAWDLESPLGEEVIVAVIDSGVYYNRTDFSGNLWDGSSECYDDSGNIISGGCPNHGWDYTNNDNNPIGEPWIFDGTDEGNHGTRVASVVSAVTNNAAGVAGVSFYNKIKLMPIRYAIDTVTRIKAINFAKNNGADIINISAGHYVYSASEQEAIESFPGIVVVSAGNDGSNNDITPRYPCSLPSDNLICVANSDYYDAVYPTSNYGGSSVDLAAPGRYIRLMYDATTYGLASGTSYSSPLVAGAVAFLKSQLPNLTNSEIKSLIINSGDDLPDGVDRTKVVSGKRLNLYNSFLDGIAMSNSVETPVASPVGGTYTSAQTITLSTATPGAEIYYTTDGTDPSIDSNLYIEPIIVSSIQTIRAIAVKSGLTDSSIMTEVYVITPIVDDPVLSPPEGVYDSSQTITLSTATSGAEIYYTTDGTTPSIDSNLYTEPFTITSSQTVQVIAVKSGWIESSIIGGYYEIVYIVEDPVASPAEGTYTSSQTITLSTATSGAEIYYTTDGTTPSIDSNLYTEPFTITSSQTVQAIAVKSGWMDSFVISEGYTISLSEVNSVIPIAEAISITSNSSDHNKYYDKYEYYKDKYRNKSSKKAYQLVRSFKKSNSKLFSQWKEIFVANKGKSNREIDATLDNETKKIYKLYKKYNGYRNYKIYKDKI